MKKGNKIIFFNSIFLPFPKSPFFETTFWKLLSWRWKIFKKIIFLKKWWRKLRVDIGVKIRHWREKSRKNKIYTQFLYLIKLFSKPYLKSPFHEDTEKVSKLDFHPEMIEKIEFCDRCKIRHLDEKRRTIFMLNSNFIPLSETNFFLCHI